jgi:hypothetical protein
VDTSKSGEIRFDKIKKPRVKSIAFPGKAAQLLLVALGEAKGLVGGGDLALWGEGVRSSF